MNIHKTIITDKSEKEIKDFALSYFRANGYYNITVTEGMKFSITSGGKPMMSPRRLSRDVFLRYKILNGEPRVSISMDIGGIKDSPVLTDLDRQFYADFLDHFEEALINQKVSIFETTEYDKKAKIYTRPYIIMSVISLIVYFLVVYSFSWEKTHHFTYPFFLVGLILGGSLINYYIRKKTKLPV